MRLLPPVCDSCCADGRQIGLGLEQMTPASSSTRGVSFATGNADDCHCWLLPAGLARKWCSWPAYCWAASCMLSRTMYHSDDPPSFSLAPASEHGAAAVACDYSAADGAQHWLIESNRHAHSCCGSPCPAACSAALLLYTTPLIQALPRSGAAGQLGVGLHPVCCRAPCTTQMTPLRLPHLAG